jgi:16S rRNA (guanine966-N2)-methyltransferase
MSDRAREGLFSSLGPLQEAIRVLDLFAGTGAMGIEALSRGAASATFVESAPAAVRTILENLRRTRLARQATVRRVDALRQIRQKPGQFDLVLLDPRTGPLPPSWRRSWLKSQVRGLWPPAAGSS